MRQHTFKIIETREMNIVAHSEGESLDEMAKQIIDDVLSGNINLENGEKTLKLIVEDDNQDF